VDIKVSTQALYYLSKKLNRALDKWTGLKLIFLADRYHLRKYARTVTDDFYYAMEHGPVASATYDVLKFDFDNVEAQKYIESFLQKKECSGNCSFVEKEEVDLDMLSDTDIEALEFAVETFGHFSSRQLRDFSHLYPEWKKFEKTLKEDSIKRIKMNFEDFFEDPDEASLKEFEFDRDPFSVIPHRIVEISKEMFLGQI